MGDELQQQAAAAQAGQDPEAGAGEHAPSPPAEKKQRDLRQEITDRMVQSLERGQIPWERPWENLEHGLPRNMATGNAYKGGNRLLLQLVQMDQGYADPRFGTVKQINELGGRVKKGEKGHPRRRASSDARQGRPQVLRVSCGQAGRGGCRQGQGERIGACRREICRTGRGRQT